MVTVGEGVDWGASAVQARRPTLPLGDLTAVASRGAAFTPGQRWLHTIGASLQGLGA
jgi:hypothetical protein